VIGLFKFDFSNFCKLAHSIKDKYRLKTAKLKMFLTGLGKLFPCDSKIFDKN
jgi:hypothetical protein